VLALTGAVVSVYKQLGETRSAQRATISLQLMQQLQSPNLTGAMALTRQAAERFRQGARANGHLSAPEYDAARAVDRFFSHVGYLTRAGAIGVDEVIVLLGPAISEMWHAVTALRGMLRERVSVTGQDDFAWLFTEWLNWDHAQRQRGAAREPIYVAAEAPVAAN
jgi:hypothetical protein